MQNIKEVVMGIILEHKRIVFVQVIVQNSEKGERGYIIIEVVGTSAEPLQNHLRTTIEPPQNHHRTTVEPP